MPEADTVPGRRRFFIYFLFYIYITRAHRAYTSKSFTIRIHFFIFLASTILLTIIIVIIKLLRFALLLYSACVFIPTIIIQYHSICYKDIVLHIVVVTLFYAVTPAHDRLTGCTGNMLSAARWVCTDYNNMYTYTVCYAHCLKCNNSINSCDIVINAFVHCTHVAAW